MKHFFIKVPYPSEVEKIGQILKKLVERDEELSKKCSFTVFAPNVEIVEICETKT